MNYERGGWSHDFGGGDPLVRLRTGPFIASAANRSSGPAPGGQTVPR
jgi:hypothetical protein